MDADDSARTDWLPVRLSEALRQCRGDGCTGAWKHDDLRANRDAAVKINHVGIEHADATARNLVTDGLRHIGAVNPVNRAAKIDGASAKRIAGAPRHPARKIGLALDHL